MRTVTLTNAKVRLAVTIACLVVSAPFAGASVVNAAAPALLPDMRMAPFYDVHLETGAGGGKRLRFGTIAFNVGDGPLEVRGKDRFRKEMQSVVQRIYRSDGSSFKRVLPDARMFYSGDGHDHFHLADYIVVSVAPLTTTGTGDEVRRLRKIGFCLIDAAQLPEADYPPPPWAPAPSSYLPGSCGTQASTSIRMGTSLGWGDDYPARFTHQSVNVTGLPAGNYRLCGTVNGNNLLREKANNHANNSYWLDITLNVAANSWQPIGEGTTPCT